MSLHDRPLVESSYLERLGEGAMNIVANGRRYELKIGLEGVRLYENGQMVGLSGWDALTGFLGHQQRRYDSLIGDRRAEVARTGRSYQDRVLRLAPTTLF